MFAVEKQWKLTVYIITLPIDNSVDDPNNE